MFVPVLALWLSLLQLSAPLAPDLVLEEVRPFAAAEDNDQRFEALTKLLTAYELSFVVEPFTVPSPVGREPRTTGRNVIVTLGDGSEDIVIGAHYDAARLGDGTLSGGAVDNAAGSVMLVHLARTLRTQPLTRRVRLVWFDMEELGLVGSARYLEAHGSSNIVAMLNFDIDAYGDTVLFGAPPGLNDERLRSAIVHSCADVALDCLRFAAMPPGDDRSFGAAGIPSLSIAILPALEAHQMWLQQHGGAAAGLAAGTVPAIMLNIHSRRDLPARVDGQSVARIHGLALALIRRLTTQP